MNQESLKLHPNFASCIDSKILRIVQDLSDKIPEITTLPKESDLPVVANIGPDDIVGEPIVSQTDITGTLVTRFYQEGDKCLGLADEGMVEARRVAERIWSRPEIRERLSLRTIEELLLDWVGDASKSRSDAPLSTKVEQTAIEKVKDLSVVIPIDELYIDEEFSFAEATVIPLSRATLDDIFNVAASEVSSERIQIARDDLHKRWLGKAGMRFELTAEPRRAQEIAFERASDYMALLQFYGAPATILRLTSHAGPTGSRSYRTVESLAYGPGSFQRAKGVSEPSYQLTMTSTERAFAERHGLLILSSLAQNTPCSYEEDLLQSLLVFGRACYQLDPTDKLLQIMTAVEMFALKSDNEPIQGNIADRLAFAITDDPDTRQAVANNFRQAYELRSGRTHHGRSISDTDTIEEFLRNVWTFFLVTVMGVGRYRTKMDFLDHLDRVKYGHK